MEQEPKADSSTVNVSQGHDSHTETNLQRTIIESLLLQACEENENSSVRWEELQRILGKEVSFPWFFRQQ